MSVDDVAREQQISDEWADTLGRCREDLEAACRDAVPVAPEVLAILSEWAAGGTDLPWSDAKQESKISNEERKAS